MIVRSAKELAIFVRESRKKAQLSQDEVADRVGLKQSTVSAFENSPESTKLDTLFRILSAADLELTIRRKGDEDLQILWSEEW